MGPCEGALHHARAHATQNGRTRMLSEFQTVMRVAHTVLKCEADARALIASGAASMNSGGLS